MHRFCSRIFHTNAPCNCIILRKNTHETSSEVMYFLSGTGKVLYDGVWEPVAPGTCHYCPKGHSHSLVNDGTEDLVTFAVVPEHEKR